jgi:peptide deformylase
MKLEFVYYPSPLLEKKCKRADDIEYALSLGKEMKEYLLQHGGLGLAANQVGHDLALAIIMFPNDKGEFNTPLIMINPEIIFESPEKKCSEEGCLSFPDLWTDVERPVEIVVKCYLEERGNATIRATGLLARIICHETDHLNGVRFIDRLTPIQKEIISGDLSKLRNKFGNT